MRLQKNRSLLTAAVFGATVALAFGCGEALPVVAVEPDEASDASLDGFRPPVAMDSGVDASDVPTPDAGPDAPPPIYAIGGTVTGLEGDGLVLENEGETIEIAKGAATFAFASKVVAGATFGLTVHTQPNTPTQQCTVSGGSGTVVSGDVASIAINCTTSAFTIGGTVVGLAGSGLMLGLEGDADAGVVDLPISVVGTFSFPARLSGSPYNVTVKGQPSNPEQDCVVANGAGTVMGADVANVDVTCTTKTFAVGGAVVGLVGAGLVLTNNGGDDEILNGPDGAFTFDTAVASGTTYAIAVKTQPTSPHQKCVVTNGTGPITNGSVATVSVTCKDIAYVDVTNGSNANSGGPTDPWKNLTHAIAAARVAPVDIIVAPGTYDAAAGETFPIRPKSQQNIVGDIANKGAGPTPTLLSGSGNATYLGGSAAGVFPHSVFFGVGVTGASLRGIQIQIPGGEGIGFETATATVEGVTLKGSDDVAFVVANGSDITVLDSDLQNGIWDVAVVDAATKLKMRRTSLSNPTETAVVLGYLTPVTGSNVDLGTDSDPGNNVIHGGPGGLGLWLYQSSSGSTVSAVGNTWKPLLQGADAAGRYPSTFIDGSSAVPYVGGNNYAITTPGTGSGIRL